MQNKFGHINQIIAHLWEKIICFNAQCHGNVNIQIKKMIQLNKHNLIKNMCYDGRCNLFKCFFFKLICVHILFLFNFTIVIYFLIMIRMQNFVYVFNIVLLVSSASKFIIIIIILLSDLIGFINFKSFFFINLKCYKTSKFLSLYYSIFWNKNKFYNVNCFVIIIYVFEQMLN